MDADLRVTVGRGRLRLSAEVCARALAGVRSAALLERDGAVWLLPLRGPAAGGRLLKQCNAAGDHVLDAPDFLAAYGLDGEAPDRCHALCWVPEAGAWRLDGLVHTRAPASDAGTGRPFATT